MENTLNVKRKNFWSLDIAKFFCALTIISAHFVSENTNFSGILDYVFSIYIIAVPFFFCCSGFLFFKKLNSLPTKEHKRSYFLQYEKRIWVMYGLWSAVYFIFVVYKWVINGTFNILTILKYLHTSLVFQTYATIWFLPALAVGIAITYYLKVHCNKGVIVVICVLLYIIGTLGYTYKFSINGTIVGNIYDYYLLAFKTTRNGLFNAVPFLFMGSLFAEKEFNHNIKQFFINGILSGIFLVAVVAECFFLKIKFQISSMDFCIFLVPFTYFFMKVLLNLDLKDSPAWLWCRKLSLLIFTSQRLFLSGLPLVFPTLFSKIYANGFIGLAAVILMTITFSVLFVNLSEKVKFFKKMM